MQKFPTELLTKVEGDLIQTFPRDLAVPRFHRLKKKRRCSVTAFQLQSGPDLTGSHEKANMKAKMTELSVTRTMAAHNTLLYVGLKPAKRW